MTVELRPVTLDNFRQVIKLQVHEAQTDFVAPNVYSVAESKFHPLWHPMAIVADDIPAGFIMWGRDDNDPHGQWWVIRLMVDAASQRQGYGRRAMELAIESMRADGAGVIFVSFVPGNDQGEVLYRRLGFEDTGLMEDGEIVYRLAFDS